MIEPRGFSNALVSSVHLYKHRSNCKFLFIQAREKVEGLSGDLGLLERDARQGLASANEELRSALEDAVERVKGATKGMHQHVEKRLERTVSVHISHQSSKYQDKIDEIRQEVSMRNTKALIILLRKKVFSM